MVILAFPQGIWLIRQTHGEGSARIHTLHHSLLSVRQNTGQSCALRTQKIMSALVTNGPNSSRSPLNGSCAQFVKTTGYCLETLGFHLLESQKLKTRMSVNGVTFTRLICPNKRIISAVDKIMFFDIFYSAVLSHPDQSRFWLIAFREAQNNSRLGVNLRAISCEWMTDREGWS